MISRNHVLSGLFITTCGLLLVNTGFAMSPQTVRVQIDHGIPYVSGGVSLDEQQMLRDMTQDDNIQLIFAAKNGDYLSDVTVQIVDARGHEVLNTVTQGPWLFTKLPAGTYTIRATIKGQSQGAMFTTPAAGQARIYLTWSNDILKIPNYGIAKE